ncbi:MAG: MFS transporter [Chloroflexi bacterium]|nr:MFS transporter [Chloroflexota bacterium]
MRASHPTPPAPPTRRIFHGWWIVATGFATDLVSMGVGLYAFGVFFVPMLAELGWSRTMVSGVFTLRTVQMALASPLVGRLADARQGARWAIALGGVLQGLGVAGLALVHAPWQFYLSYGVLAALGPLATGNLVTATVVAKWFRRMRGRAVSIVVTGGGVGGVVVVPVAQLLVSHVGWRAGWAILGIFSGVVVASLALLFIRRQPEDMGLSPDGQVAGGTPVAAAAAQERATAGEVSWTLRDAVRTRALWTLTLAFALEFSSGFAMIVHMRPFFDDKDFSPAAGTALYTLYFLCFAVFRIPWGLYLERANLRVLAAISCLGTAVGWLGVMLSPNLPTAVVALLFFGILQSAALPLASTIWPSYFGRDSLGTIRGVTQPVQFAFNAVTPLLAGALFDATGSYMIPFLIFVGAYSFAGVLFLLAAPPMQRLQRS